MDMEEQKETKGESLRLMLKGFFAIFKKQWWMLLVSLFALLFASATGFFFFPLIQKGLPLYGYLSLGMFVLFAAITLALNHLIVSEGFKHEYEVNDFGSRVLYIIMYLLLICVVMGVTFYFLEQSKDYEFLLKPGFAGGCSLIVFYCLWVGQTLFDYKIFKKGNK